MFLVFSVAKVLSKQCRYFCGHVGLLSSVFGSNDGCFNISQPLSSYNDVCVLPGSLSIAMGLPQKVAISSFGIPIGLLASRCA